MMRRYHLTLEEVLGEPLPRHEVSNGRLIDGEHLRLLLAARELVKRDNLSVKHALRQLLSIPAAPPLPSPQQGGSADLTPLLEALERQSQEIAALREEVSGLRRQLDAPDTQQHPPRLRDEVRGLIRALLERVRQH